MPNPVVIEPESAQAMKSARAAFANLARMNLFSTLGFISDAVGIQDPDKSEEHILDMKILNLDNTLQQAADRQKAFRLMCRHFGFIRYMNEEDEKRKKDKGENYIKTLGYDKFVDILKRAITVLIYYRDQSTHHAFRDERNTDRSYLEAEALLAWELDTCFTIAIRVIKERFKKDFSNERTKHCLDFLNGRTRKDNSGKTVLNDKHSFALARMDREGHLRLTEFGKVYLLSLFLSKQYASELLDKWYSQEPGNGAWRDPAPADSPQRSYLRDILSALRIRLPHDRIDSTVGIDQIGMDMLGELKRCPKELFPILAANDQKLFEAIDSSTGDKVLMRRSSDRFPHLALSYIDYTGLFKSARFAINVGQYRYVFKDKKICIDGSTEPRILQKDLNGFGRIQEIEALRTLEPQAPDNPWPYQSLIKGYEETPRKDAECCPYIRDTRTHYLFNHDRIGVCFGPKPDAFPTPYDSSLTESEDKIWYLPAITPSPGQGGHAKVSCVEPHCWLSIYDIPAMTFLAFLTKDRISQGLQYVEYIMLECVLRYRALFKDIADGSVFDGVQQDIEAHIRTKYGIAFKDIPKSLQHFLKKEGYDADARFREHLIRVIEGDAKSGVKGLIERTDNRKASWKRDLQSVSSVKENKAGKEGFVEIKTGTLMSWLLKDIVYIQKYLPVTDPVTGLTRSNKLTGLNYAKLQGLLSAFPFKTAKELIDLFKEYGIWDTHHFLKGAIIEGDKPDPLVFYEHYLEERAFFFEDLADILKQGKMIDNYGFVKAERRKWQRDYLKTLPKEFYNSETGRFCPIFLPSGLFEKPLREQLDRIPELRAALSEGDKDGRKANTTYMIKKYFEIVRGDGHQRYYDFMRTYPFHEYIDKKRKDIKVQNIRATNLSTGEVSDDSNFRRAVKEVLSSRPAAQSDTRQNHTRPGHTQPTPYSVDTLKKKWKEMSETERTLRRYEVQDMLLFMLGTSIVLHTDTGARLAKTGLLLKNVMGGNEGTDILSQPVNITTSVKIRQKIYKIQQTEVKIRDYTKIFALLRDTRTRSLLPVLPNEVIDAAELQDELNRYDIERPKVFMDLLIFEKTQYDSYHSYLSEGRIDFRRLLELDSTLPEEKKEILRLIRNAFSHNTYANPQKAQYEARLRPQPEHGPAESMEQNVKEIVNRQ